MTLTNAFLYVSSNILISIGSCLLALIWIAIIGVVIHYIARFSNSFKTITKTIFAVFNLCIVTLANVPLITALIYYEYNTASNLTNACLAMILVMNLFGSISGIRLSLEPFKIDERIY